MDSKILTGTALSYLAVYNQDLREEMEECGAFSDSLEEKIALDEAEKWIQKAIKSPGAFTAKAKDHGMDVQEFAAYVDKNPEKFDTKTQRQANLAQTLKGIQNEERAPGVKPYQPKERNPLPKAKPLSGERGDRTGYGPDEKFKDWTASATPSTVSKTGQTVSQRMDAEKPYGKRMTGPLAREYGSRHAAEVTRVVRGPGEPQAVTYPRQGREEKKPKAKTRLSREIIRRGKQEEGFDLYDLVLAHLLDEAEGSYGSTPKAHLAFSALARKRNKDKRTKGGDIAASHARRTDSRPNSSDQDRIRRSMTQSDRDKARGASKYGHVNYDPDFDGPPSGPGGNPKGKKLARQKATGVSAESYDLYDIILSHLLDEGYAETPEQAEVIMVNMSEDWRDSIIG